MTDFYSHVNKLDYIGDDHFLLMMCIYFICFANSSYWNLEPVSYDKFGFSRLDLNENKPAKGNT